MLRAGTTTAEVKSGYGLDAANELKILAAIERLDAAQAIDLVRPSSARMPCRRSTPGGPRTTPAP